MRRGRKGSAEGVQLSWPLHLPKMLRPETGALSRDRGAPILCKGRGGDRGVQRRLDCTRVRVCSGRFSSLRASWEGMDGPGRASWPLSQRERPDERRL